LMSGSASGFGAARPFYIVGHDPDSIAEAKACLEAGANALEPDINVTAAHRDQLVVGHGPELTTGPAADDAEPLEAFLDGLHALAKERPDFSLVYFDCKSLAAKPALGQKLLAAARAHLVGSGADAVRVKFIISVATRKDAAIFRDLAGSLHAHEAVMIDQEGDPAAVLGYLGAMGFPIPCYANGISFFNSWSWLIKPGLRSSIAAAAQLRRSGTPLPLILTWTVNNPRVMERYIRLGVDGILADDDSPAHNCGPGLKALVQLMDRDGARLGIRRATQADDPF